MFQCRLRGRRSVKNEQVNLKHSTDAGCACAEGELRGCGSYCWLELKLLC